MEVMMNATSTFWESNSTIDYNNITDLSDSCVYGGHVIHFFTALYCVIFVVGFIGNTLVVWVIIVGAHLKSMADVCLLNLALADLLLILSLPFLIYHAYHDWIFGEVLCILIFGMYYVGFYSGIFFIVLMSIDRYLAIVHAVFALRVRTKACGTVASLVTWILAVAASFPDLLYIRVEEQSVEVICTQFPKDINSVILVIFKKNIVGLLVPLIIVGFCYSMILLRLYRSRSPKKHSMHLVVLVMVVFFCCWIPYNITEFLVALLFMGVIPDECEFIKRITLTEQMTRALAFLHSCLNPFLYVFVGEKFKKHLIRLIRERQSTCCS